MIGLDSNVLIRYFAQDDARQSAIAATLIDNAAAEPFHVSLVALAEFVWVMRRTYRNSVETISDALVLLLADERFVVQASSEAWAALDAYRRLGADFADALIAALDRRRGCRETVTFDKGAARLDGVRLLS